MARQYKTGLIITGDASGGIKAVRATEKELGQLNQRFDQGGKRAKRFARQTSGVSREMQVLRRMAAPVGAALAGMFAANSLRNQINFADQLQKTNLRIGASTEALSEYSHVANLAGVQFDQLTTAWQRQSRRIAQAAQDTGEAQEALAALNLDAVELAQLAPEDQFERIAGAMNGVASEAQRVALAQKIWDSEGVRLLQIVNQGTDAIRAQREEAERLGLTISQDTAEAMAGFNDEVTRMTAVGEGLSRQILADLVPAMTSGMQATSAWIEEMGGAAEILDSTKDIAGALAAVLAGRLAGSLAIATARLTATATAAGALRGALALVGGPIGLLVGGGGLLYVFREELGLVETASYNSTEALNANTQAIRDGGKAALNTSYEALTLELEAVSLKAQEAMARMLELNRMQGFYDDSHQGMSDVISEQASDQEQLLADLWDHMVDLQAAMERNRNAREKLTDAEEDGVATLSQLNEESEAAKKAAEEQAKSLEDLRRAMDPLRAEHAQYIDRISVLNQALGDGTVKQEEYGEAVRWAAGQYVRAATGAEEYEKQQKSLVAQYDRHHQKAQQLREDLANINEMYRRGDIDGDTYSRMIANVRDEMRQLALDADPFAQDMARAWEEASNRIDETFANAFAGAFDSFDDFADQLLDGFKRLLAELAYQAALRPIVVGFAADMQNMLGMGSVQGGGFSNTLSGINSVAGNIGKVTDFLGLTSSLGVAGSAPISYATGFGAQVATGTYTGALGNATAAASTSTSGVLSTLSSAAPWIGGALALDSMLDLGIVDGIVDGVSSALGISGKYAGEDPTGLLATRNAYGSAGRAGWERDAFATGALGDIGFAPDSRDIDTLFGERDNFENAKAFAEQLAQMDTTIAQLAESEAELDAMRQAAADADLTDMVSLEDRYRAVLGSLGEEFDAYVDTLDGDLGEIVQQAVTAGQAFNVMSDAAERLNLQFDASATGAYETAAALAEAAGGIDQLASVQQGYYQAVTTEAERLSWSYSELTQSLSEHVDAIPRSVEEYRNLVEGLDLSTESGRELYLVLTQLAPAFAESVQAIEQAITGAYQEHLGRAPEIEGFEYWVDRVQSGALSLIDAIEYIANSTEAAAGGMDATRMRIEIMRLEGREAAAVAEERRIELAYMEQSLRPLQQRIWALEDEAQAQAEAERRQQERNRALEQERRAMEQAQRTLAGFTTSINDWLAQLRGTDAGMGTPQEQLTATRSDFASQLILAESGDRAALQSITQYADRYLQAGQGMYASGAGAQQIRREIEQALSSLPDVLSPEMFLAEEFRGAIGDQTMELVTAIDLNGDGQISELERVVSSNLSASDIINGTLDSLPNAIAASVSPLFDQIDLDASGLIDYKEFERIFAGMATDAQLQRIFSELDTNGDGQISRLESIRRSSDKIDDNTHPLNAANLLDGLPVSLARDHMPGAWQDMAYNVVQEFKAQGVEGFAKGGAFVGGVQAFANGGAFTNSVVSSPTTFPMGLMGEAGPEAIMPLSRTADGSLGVRAEVAPVMPEFPLLGGNDVAQVMRDLRSEVAQLRRELADSQRQIADNTGQTRDAVAGVGRHAAQQREQQLSEQRGANRALRRQQRGQTV